MIVETQVNGANKTKKDQRKSSATYTNSTENQ